MIGHDPNAGPAGAQERRDPVDECINLRIDLANEERVERMPTRVQLSGFGPAAAFTAHGHGGLVGVEDFNTGARHRIAES
jgi:hypothetical protein